MNFAIYIPQSAFDMARLRQSILQQALSASANKRP